MGNGSKEGLTVFTPSDSGQNLNFWLNRNVIRLIKLLYFIYLFPQFFKCSNFSLNCTFPNKHRNADKQFLWSILLQTMCLLQRDYWQRMVSWYFLILHIYNIFIQICCKLSLDCIKYTSKWLIKNNILNSKLYTDMEIAS